MTKAGSAPAVYGLSLSDLEEGGVEAARKTRESSIVLQISFGARDPEAALDTGIDFFSHMLEMIAWYGGFNLRVSYTTLRYRLTHVVCEDVGIVLGHAVRRVIEGRIEQGVASVGEAHGGIDEALAFCYFSLEGRANHHIVIPEAQLGGVEDSFGRDLVQFFEGFAQGSRGTLHLRLLSGSDPHHQWEACFRAFARALRAAMAPDPWKANATAGVKGTLD